MQEKRRERKVPRVLYTQQSNDPFNEFKIFVPVKRMIRTLRGLNFVPLFSTVPPLSSRVVVFLMHTLLEDLVNHYIFNGNGQRHGTICINLSPIDETASLSLSQVSTVATVCQDSLLDISTLTESWSGTLSDTWELLWQNISSLFLKLESMASHRHRVLV